MLPLRRMECSGEYRTKYEHSFVRLPKSFLTPCTPSASTLKAISLMLVLPLVNRSSGVAIPQSPVTTVLFFLETSLAMIRIEQDHAPLPQVFSDNKLKLIREMTKSDVNSDNIIQVTIPDLFLIR